MKTSRLWRNFCSDEIDVFFFSKDRNELYSINILESQSDSFREIKIAKDGDLHQKLYYNEYGADPMKDAP